MAVKCGNCGEELMGSVNRCWRCGQSLRAHAGPAHIPPVRRPPIRGDLQGPLDAVLMDDVPPVTTGVTPRRQGSPFAAGSPVQRLPIPVVPDQPLADKRPRVTAAAGAARQMSSGISMVLSLVALSLSFTFPLGAVLIALAALGFAVWGLTAPHRQIALGALIVACLVLALAIFIGALQLYQLLYPAGAGTL